MLRLGRFPFQTPNLFLKGKRFWLREEGKIRVIPVSCSQVHFIHGSSSQCSALSAAHAEGLLNVFCDLIASGPQLSAAWRHLTLDRNLCSV